MTESTGIMLLAALIIGAIMYATPTDADHKTCEKLHSAATCNHALLP